MQRKTSWEIDAEVGKAHHMRVTWHRQHRSRRYPGPPILRLTPILTLDPSPAMLSMVHDYDLATGGNHEGRKP